MKQAATRELFAYWNMVRRSRAAPERSEIDPAAIRTILADTFILEVDDTHVFPFRVAGTRVNALWAAELRGRSFLDLWMARDRRSLSALLLTIVDGACPVVAGAAAPVVNERELEVELLLLPLRHHGRTHARILGLMTPVRHPSWLGLRPLEPLDLRTLRVVGSEDAELAPTYHVLDTQRPAQGTPHLRIIQGGREATDVLVDELAQPFTRPLDRLT